MTKPKIYISSTFFDLEEHRKAIIDALLKTRVFDVVGMEYYGTQSIAPLDLCLRDVADCDFYILLLGKRYGFIPAGQKYSITNLEYKKAIGDDDADVVAAVPQYQDRVVLPFLQNLNYVTRPEIEAKIAAETAADTPDVAQFKKESLSALKKCIQRDYVIDKEFTTPEDLVGKVIGALIPALTQKGYISEVKSLVIKPDVIKRCNRDRLRADFLYENTQATDLFRLFVVHGEQAELPMVFSDCVGQYDLNVKDTYQIILEDYFSTTPEKFVMKMVRDIYQKIYDEYPEPDDSYGLRSFANRVMSATNQQTIVVKLELLYATWAKRYTDYFKLLFSMICNINAGIKTPRNIFFLINVRYIDNSADLIEQIDVPAVMLDKLGRINILHIQDWISAHLFPSSDKANSRAFANKISGFYFDEKVNNGAETTLSTVMPVLGRIVNDFNNNKNLFEDYKNLFS